MLTKEEKVIQRSLIPHLETMIESKVKMDNFKHFNSNVGVDSMQFVGLPGSGKTSFSMLICKDLMKERGENILISGDRFSEFRHFLRYPRFVEKLWFLYPDNQQLFYYKIPHRENHPDDKKISEKYNLDFESKMINLDKFNIKDYLTNDTKSNVFVIYDNHYKGRLIWKRAELWKRITDQLLERTVLIDNQAITTLYNEAGILWKEGAKGKHWDEVDEYAEISVENRKGLVRRMTNSQLETEIYHPIRKKDLWKVYRLGTTAKLVRREVREAAPFQSRSSYILTYGGLFRINNQTPKLTELKEKWKIIPIGMPDIQDDEDDETINKHGYSLKIKAGVIKRHIYNNESIRSLAKDFGINRETLTNWSKNDDILQYCEKLV
jgi:hypothetical protein